MAVANAGAAAGAAWGLEEDQSGLAGKLPSCSGRPPASGGVGDGWQAWLYGWLYSQARNLNPCREGDLQLLRSGPKQT
jgi:hypothetical protein